MTPETLARLHRLAGLHKMRAESDLASSLAEQARISQERRGLGDAGPQAILPLLGPTDPALIAAVAARQGWQARRRIWLARQEAALAPTLARQRSALARATGRTDVLTRLEASARAEAMRTAERRAESDAIGAPAARTALGPDPLPPGAAGSRQHPHGSAPAGRIVDPIR